MPLSCSTPSLAKMLATCSFCRMRSDHPPLLNAIVILVSDCRRQPGVYASSRAVSYYPAAE